MLLLSDLQDLSEEEKRIIVSKKLNDQVLLNKPYMYDTNITVQEHIQRHISLLGEKIRINRFSKFIIGE